MAANHRNIPFQRWRIAAQLLLILLSFLPLWLIRCPQEPRPEPVPAYSHVEQPDSTPHIPVP